MKRLRASLGWCILAWMTDVSQLMAAAERGDMVAARQLLPLVYDELRRLAAVRLADERPGLTLDPTALVHEAYLRLAGDQVFRTRGHFLAAAAEAMRRILVERARRKARHKHGGGRQREPLHENVAFAPEPEESLLALEEALMELAQQYPTHARLVELRYFGGATGEEAAQHLGISASTADRHWVFAKAWLKRRLGTASSRKD